MTQKSEGSAFAATVYKYRCSNRQCQEEIDRQKAKRLKLLKEKELAVKKRNNLKLSQKALAKQPQTG